jgi:flagellin-like hook-associated protein FlgL
MGESGSSGGSGFTAGGGGTQVAGGPAGYTFQTTQDGGLGYGGGTGDYHNAGGGGGWYGGGSGAGHAGAGGGSSYIGEVSDGSTQSGVRSGNGLVEISYDGTSPGTYSNTVDSAPDKVLSNFTVSSNRTLSLTSADGNSQSLDYVLGNQETLAFSNFGIQVDLSSAYDPSNGLDGKGVEIAANRDLQVGADNDINHQLQLGISSVTASGLRIDGSQVVDIDQARAAITSLDHATDMVNQERSYLGSMQNRLSFTMSNLTSNIQSIESSRSSIEDVDFAAEATNLAKNQILAQSGTAMLAQAAVISQNILGLLA